MGQFVPRSFFRSLVQGSWDLSPVAAYHGREDIPDEHKVFSMPKLNIREQMAAYKEVIDRSSLEGERLHPRKEVPER